MKSTSKSFLYEVIFIVTSVFPLALSMSVCSGMGVFAGMFFSVAAALIAAVNYSQNGSASLDVAVELAIKITVFSSGLIASFLKT